MVKILSAFFALTLPLCAGEKMTLLKLTDGTEYKSVEIMGVSAKGLRILHNSGAANVPIDQLPAELQAKYAPAHQKAVAESAATTEAATSKPKPEADSKPSAPQETPAPKTALAPAPVAPGKPADALPAAPASNNKPRGQQKVLVEIVTGKIFGLAEVLADMHSLDGKVARVEVIANSASRIESHGPGLYKIFVGDPIAKTDSDWTFITFPESGRKKIQTMLNGNRGKMTFYMEVRAGEPIPLHAVGRSTSSGSPGTPINIIW